MSTQAQSWFAINRAADAPDTAEVRIYDVIGSWGVTAKDFVNELKAIKAKQIDIRINTVGGEISDGNAIATAIKEHPAATTAYVDGLAASAGSFVAIAADKVRMETSAFMMVHNAHGGAMGGAEELHNYATVLEKMNRNIAGMYAAKTGKPVAYWLDKMSAESWFTAQEAMDEGLVDEVYTATKKKQPEKMTACTPFDFRIYNKAPDAAKALWGNVVPSAVIKLVAPTDTIQQVTPAPEAPSPTAVVEPPPSATPNQEPPMADNPVVTTAPPAQPPAAGPVLNSSQGELVRLTDAAVQGFIEKGKIIGRAEGRAACMGEFREIVTASANKPHVAITAFLAGQNAATVKLLVEAETNAEIKANERFNEQQIEIARLRAEQARLTELNAIGGHPGVPGFPAPQVYAPGAHAAAEAHTGLEPEAQAKLEWDSDPVLRAKHNNQEKHYLLFRVNQLKGNVKVLAKSA